MKVAIFSDVQAILPAMEEAVERIQAWGPDLVAMAGDLVNRGPKSRQCLDLFDRMRRERGWLPIQGNHEDWVLRCGHEAPTNPLDEEMRRFADWTYRQVAPSLPALTDWPNHLCFQGPGEAGWVHVTHGTMLGNRDGVSAATPDEVLRSKIPSDLALFVTAHTHRPMERMLDGTAVLNVGSVGSPFDGDPRGSYALLECRGARWHWEIVRFPYDRVRAVRDFKETGFLEEGGPIARILYQEWYQARSLMPLWRRHHEPAVLAGERPLGAAVDGFLAEIGL
jgi:predicted phosphodiesterase